LTDRQQACEKREEGREEGRKGRRKEGREDALKTDLKEGDDNQKESIRSDSTRVNLVQ